MSLARREVIHEGWFVIRILADAPDRRIQTVPHHQYTSSGGGGIWYTWSPCGVASAPALFQKATDEILQGLPNIICYLDDILVTRALDREPLEETQRSIYMYLPGQLLHESQPWRWIPACGRTETYFGTEQLVSDNVPLFLSDEIACFWTFHGIKHIHVSPDHPLSWFGGEFRVNIEGSYEKEWKGWPLACYFSTTELVSSFSTVPLNKEAVYTSLCVGLRRWHLFGLTVTTFPKQSFCKPPQQASFCVGRSDCSCLQFPQEAPLGLSHHY